MKSRADIAQTPGWLSAVRPRLAAVTEQLVCRVGVYRPTRNLYHRTLKRSMLRTRKRWQRFFRAFISPGDLVFDVGANMGQLTAEFLELGASVVAVEPLPTLASRIRMRYRCSALAIEPVAVGPREGSAALHVGVHHQLSTLAKDRIAERPELWRDTTEVPVVTLDSLIERYGSPRFLKIDVEGYERDVLKGLSSPIEALSFEFGLVPLEQVAACLDQLSRFAAYEFNFSVGAEYRFRDPEWVDSADLLGGLEELMRTERGTFEVRVQGDVYARRRR